MRDLVGLRVAGVGYCEAEGGLEVDDHGVEGAVVFDEDSLPAHEESHVVARGGGDAGWVSDG